MKENVTAEWAKKTAEQILGEKQQKSLLKCLSAIETAVNNNQMSASVYDYVDEVVIKDLKNRGFNVVKFSDPRDGGSISISW